jgi:signal transduction histidine kinase
VASITDLSTQKKLERQIARIGEEERRHIGRFLHDELVFRLAGVEALSSLLSSRLAKSEHPDTGLALEIKAVINQAVKKTKHLAQLINEEHDLEVTGEAGTVESAIRQVLKSAAQLMKYAVAYSLTCKN